MILFKVLQIRSAEKEDMSLFSLNMTLFVLWVEFGKSDSFVKWNNWLNFLKSHLHERSESVLLG